MVYWWDRNYLKLTSFRAGIEFLIAQVTATIRAFLALTEWRTYPMEATAYPLPYLLDLFFCNCHNVDSFGRDLIRRAGDRMTQADFPRYFLYAIAAIFGLKAVPYP